MITPTFGIDDDAEDGLLFLTMNLISTVGSKRAHHRVGENRRGLYVSSEKDNLGGIPTPMKTMWLTRLVSLEEG